MKILVTGAKGFVGKNLVELLKSIRDGKKRDTKLSISAIYEYDVNNSLDELDLYCSECDFVFNLVGVNRTQNMLEFMIGNCDFAVTLLNTLNQNHNTCPVMLSSSIQASLIGDYVDSEYGKSKLAGEEIFFKYANETGAKVFVYRFPNLFGKWCKPNYNSVIATFCNSIANDQPYTVNDKNKKLELLYIDDLMNEMLSLLLGNAHYCNYDGLNSVEDKNGRYCYVPVTYHVSLGEIIDLLESFKQQPSTLCFTPASYDSFEKKLYATFLSYFPENKMMFDLKSFVDERGSFTEFFKANNFGQFSINISKPGIVKGQHWHNTKVEIFLVVSGHGLVQERKIGLDETGKPYPIKEFEVSGEKLQCIYILPGYTHNLINLSKTENMITLIWSNELFDSEHPETYHENVVITG